MTATDETDTPMSTNKPQSHQTAPMTANELDELAALLDAVYDKTTDQYKAGSFIEWPEFRSRLIDAAPQLIAAARDGLRWWTIMDEIKEHGKDHPEYMQAWELVIAWRGAIRTDAVPDAARAATEGDEHGE